MYKKHMYVGYVRLSTVITAAALGFITAVMLLALSLNDVVMPDFPAQQDGVSFAEPPVAARILVLYQINVEDNWQNIVEDQIMKLMFSGLYQQLDRIFCSVSTLSSSPILDEFAQVSQLLSGFGSKFSVFDLPGGFNITRSIATVSNLTATDHVLFISTQSSLGGYAAENKTSEELTHQLMWRNFMEYEMIKCHRQRRTELRHRNIVGKYSSLHTVFFTKIM